MRTKDRTLSNDQRQWLQQERDAYPVDTACLDRVYDRRTDALLKLFDANAGLTSRRRIADERHQYAPAGAPWHLEKRRAARKTRDVRAA
jgi:uncharacterized protein